MLRWMWMGLLAGCVQPEASGRVHEVPTTGPAYHQAVREVLEAGPGELRSLECDPEPCVGVLRMPSLEEDGGASRNEVKAAVREAGFTLAIPVLFREYEGGVALLSVVPAAVRAEGDTRDKLEIRMRNLQNDVLASKRVTVDPSAREE